MMKKKPDSVNRHTFLRPQVAWQDLWFYRKADVLYQLTTAFTARFLPTHGDRTVDQMVQAARSGKQNIVEGSADGVTSTEMEIKLLNVARASIQELQEDYVDYLRRHRLTLWDSRHERSTELIRFCRENNDYAAYEPYIARWCDEEMANVGYTLCRMVDRMMTTYIKKLEEQFVSEGGIRERMTAARLGYRNDMKRQLEQVGQENAMLKAENEQLRAENEQLRTIIARLELQL